MRIDFSQIPLKNRAFSNKPMSFCDPDAKTCLSAVIDLVAIETGNRTAREYWQTTQLRNLLAHAARKSAFWRKRIGARAADNINITSLPVLTRAQLVDQVKSEGPLIQPGDRMAVTSHSTSGSSGTPVSFFVSEMNVLYNETRSTAQYFLEGRDLSHNRTRLRYVPMHDTRQFKVHKTELWQSSLGSLFRCGINKQIEYFNADMKLLTEELERDSIGYLVAVPWTVEAIVQYIDPISLKHAGMTMWIPTGTAVDPALRGVFSAVGIPVRAIYSSEEVGFIGSECEEIVGNYHVATSNVIAEVSYDEGIRIDGERVGRVLVTHLHSYATPFIRYDLGDLASFANCCACGHDGPTLSNVHGRTKNLLKHLDGRTTPFFVKSAALAKIAEFTEYRMRQTDFRTIVLEIGGRDVLSEPEIAGFRNLITAYAGEEFEIQVRAVPSIEWGNNVKRLGFQSEVL